MFRGEYGTCSKCGEQKWIVVKKKYLCDYCNKVAKGYDPQAGLTGPVKRKPIKSKRKKTGELEVFLMIWEERMHVSEVSGRPLLPKTHDMWINQFSHILTKGSYPEFRLLKENIILKLPEEHTLWENFKHQIRDIPMWKPIFLLEEALKERYNKQYRHK